MNMLAVIQRIWPEVTKVVDAKAPDHIDVLPQDKKGASAKSPANCVFARACKRRFGDDALVSLTMAYVRKGRLAIRYSLSSKMHDEAIAYDRSGGVGDTVDEQQYILKPPASRTKAVPLAPRVKVIPPQPSRRLGAQAPGRPRGPGKHSRTPLTRPTLAQFSERLLARS